MEPYISKQNVKLSLLQTHLPTFTTNSQSRVTSKDNNENLYKDLPTVSLFQTPHWAKIIEQSSPIMMSLKITR